MNHKNQKQMICGVESTLWIYCGGDYEAASADAVGDYNCGSLSFKGVRLKMKTSSGQNDKNMMAAGWSNSNGDYES